MIRDRNETERPALTRLVQAAMSQPCPAPAGPVAEYDWKSPSRFTGPQLGKLASVAQEMAAEVSKALAGLLKADPQLRAEDVRQHYAADLGGGDDGNTHLLAALAGDDGKRCGWFALPPETASAWVARLMGGPASSAGPHELSALECSLLADLVSAAAMSLSALLRKGGCRAIRGQDAIVRQKDLAPDDAGQEYCRFGFRPSAETDKTSCDLILLSDWLMPLAAADAKAAARPPADVQKDLLGHLTQVSVEASATLGAATVMMQDVMSLEEGDVIVTGTRLGEPIVLAVQGQPVLKAVPVFSDGCYALRVTDVIRPDPKKRPPGN